MSKTVGAGSKRVGRREEDLKGKSVLEFKQISGFLASLPLK